MLLYPKNEICSAFDSICFGHSLLGHLDIVKLLIEVGMNVTSVPEALHYAAKKKGDFDANLKIEIFHVNFKLLCNIFFIFLSGNVNVVKYLIKNGAQVQYKDEYRSTPLHMASECGI